MREFVLLPPQVNQDLAVCTILQHCVPLNVMSNMASAASPIANDEVRCARCLQHAPALQQARSHCELERSGQKQNSHFTTFKGVAASGSHLSIVCRSGAPRRLRVLIADGREMAC